MRSYTCLFFHYLAGFFIKIYIGRCHYSCILSIAHILLLIDTTKHKYQFSLIFPQQPHKKLLEYSTGIPQNPVSSCNHSAPTTVTQPPSLQINKKVFVKVQTMNQMRQRPQTAGLRKKIQHYSYDITQQIGRGYSSVVYKGCDDRNNQLVAIKVIDLKSLKDQFAKEMLFSEISIITKLKHPNILRCYDVYSTVNNCYIITEYCGDGDLAGQLHTVGRFQEPVALSLMRDIVAGFVEIASRGYLHRDLKPANILVKKGVCKIADFGFAKKYAVGGCGDQGKVEKYNVGSPLYMSPEALSLNRYSVKNDVWALGIIMYELLHGRTPWSCKSEQELADKIANVPPVIDVPVSEQVRQFLFGCLDPQQSNRFSLEELKNCQLVRRLLNSQLDRKEKAGNESAIKMLKKKSSNKENEVPVVQLQRKTKVEEEALRESINICRLLYKIVTRVKDLCASETHLIHVLSKQVLSRINYLKAIASEGRIDCYANSNRFKMAINQYYYKYNQEMKTEDIAIKPGDLTNCLVTFLKINSKSDLLNKQTLLFYWMVEFLGLVQHPKNVQEVIHPKSTISQDAVKRKIMQL